jgi:KTSC domain
MNATDLHASSHVLLLSSSLASAGYQTEAQVLEVKFQNGTTYRYFDVPSDVFASLLAAESKGRYFNAHVRGHFDYRRL